MNLIFLGWHVPAAYDFALHTNIGTSSSMSVFWRVHSPFGGASSGLGRPKSDGTTGDWLLYLLSADLVNTALSAFLAFCDWPVYSYYLNQPNPFHLSPLSDQVLGAVIMWVVGSFVFLAPATWITFRLLQAPSTRTA